ncbi:GNAT family N-acetyltransferase [Devosia ginsengisoli]|uniref:GNAT family N-acetyltransferase n=1 Tax=Devosia ginsengisoli TaxID=400770 RepID=A0A5B8LT31_9HYPH|nr:GNAT family N-acetyltransferase [Devosia ginsengisoli]QDZ10652.1 GNAT family N-acetyltransferase [Devosia ginsengisoli]
MAITYAQETGLTAEDYVGVIGQTIMRDRRPLANTARIQAMLDGANFVVTARDDDGTLVGLARCITDHAWICYCAELAVRDSHQGQGIGRAILDKAAELLGPRIGLTLMADEEAVGFYRNIGMEPANGFWRPRSDRS